ncbi:hypothetical protein [Actinomyces sp. ZJ308]|uniref:hypothetical protein n=1 Tax=Actinomyces sp. ZJ308 TaxID=2708342 RepID=UPI00141EF388|nr:hypothetical protein [Actinomyces sp. ZJ308]
MSTTNLERLIADEQRKHAERLKRLRTQAEKQEKILFQEIARLLRAQDPERFEQYAEHVKQQREADRQARSERAAASRARKKAETGSEDGGRYE